MSDFNDANRDPLTNEPGAHPVGTGVGAMMAGAAAGAAAGALGGPVGVLPWVALQLALPPVLSAARSALPLVA